MGGQKAKRPKSGKGRRGGGGSSGAGSGADDGPVAFVPSAGRGCHLAPTGWAPWMLGLERLDPEDYDSDCELPDLALDPEERTLSLCNASDRRRAFFVTAFHPARGKGGRALQAGLTRDPVAGERECVTFVVLARPRTLTKLCRLELPAGAAGFDGVEVDSDVQDAVPHPSPDAPLLPQHAGLCFPLAGPGPFLCTQAAGGSLTHVLSACSWHAVDFRCAVGTPLVAASDGEVVGVKDDVEGVAGIAVSNLFAWNSVTLRLPQEGLFVEYVHVRRGSCRVKVGDKVKRGQVVCESGDVGFTPEPHLHIQAAESIDNDAPTVRFGFEGAGGRYYEPVAGREYDESGPIPVEGAEGTEGQ